MKKLLVIVLALVAAALAAWFMLRPTALVIRVAGGTAVKQVPGTITVRAEYQMDLKSDAGGRVVKSSLEVGKEVKAGDLLVQLDSTDIQMDIDRTESQYETEKQRQAVGSSIKLELDSAKDSLEISESLTKIGNLALSELERRRRGVKQLEQRVALEEVNNARSLADFENALAVKRRQLEKMSITAPFDGVISAVDVWPGDLIGGGTPVASVITLARRVEGKISEEDFADIRVGQKASVRLLGYGNQQFDAKVTRVLPTADPDTQRYTVYLDVTIPKERLVPGLTGEVSVVVGQRHAQTIIPRRALSGDDVYVVEDGRVRLRRVEAGYVSLTQVEILKGLAPGDLVIVEALDTFRAGQRVKTELLSQK